MGFLMNENLARDPERALKAQSVGEASFLRIVIAFDRTEDSLPAGRLKASVHNSGGASESASKHRALFISEVFLAQIELGSADIHEEGVQKQELARVAKSVRQAMEAMSDESAASVSRPQNKSEHQQPVWSAERIAQTQIALRAPRLLSQDFFVFLGLPAIEWAPNSGIHALPDRFAQSLSMAFGSPVKRFEGRSLIGYGGSEPMPTAGQAIDTVRDAIAETNMDPLGAAFQDPSFVAQRERVALAKEINPQKASKSVETPTARRTRL